MRPRRWGRSKCSASRICWPAAFARFTKRLRSASSLFDFVGQTFLSVLREMAGTGQARMPVPPGIQEGKKDMAEKIVVEGAPRSTRGKNEARRLRQTGQVPAV